MSTHRRGEGGEGRRQEGWVLGLFLEENLGWLYIFETCGSLNSKFYGNNIELSKFSMDIGRCSPKFLPVSLLVLYNIVP